MGRSRGGKEVLIQQKYGGQEEWKSHFEYLFPFFLDDRYIKKEGKPVILIYRLDKIPRYKEMFSYWRKLAKEHGLEGLHIVQMVFFDGERKLRGVDAYTFYVPAAITGKEKGTIYKKGTTVGAGANILPNVIIGENCIIGAGAVVTKNIPDRKVVMGIPAKIVRNVED